MTWIDELRRLLQRVRRDPPAESPPGDLACHEAAERIFEWLDGELEAELSERVGEHLRVCARCYPRLKFETSFREALARAPGSEVVPEELEERILAGLAEEGFTAP